MTLTPFETEILKMFDESFTRDYIPDGSMKYVELRGSEVVSLKDFLLTQLRLARTDERKQAYEEGKNAAVENLYNSSTITPSGFLIPIEVMDNARKA